MAVAEGTCSLQVGYVVAVALRDGSCPPLGQIQSLDQYGVRLTLLDWVVGDFCGWDAFVPWTSIEHMLVCTPEHTSVEDFLESAKGFQQRHEKRK